MRSAPLTLALVACAGLAPRAAADDGSLRCPGGLVSIGDSKLDLLAKCGAPALREGHVEERWVGASAAVPVHRRFVTLGVESWTYDFGPRSFLAFVRIELGKVVRIERGGYGYGTPAPPPEPPRRARCDPSALREGDSRYDVLSRCGEPASIDAEEEVWPVPVSDASVVPYRVTIEVWTYDFGPTTLVRFVRFEGDRVARVETGGRGYAQP